jgi:hypothetical protein
LSCMSASGPRGTTLTEGHEMGAILGHGIRNRPLLGFVKRHRIENLKIENELNIVLGCHLRAGNERGVNLCLWAGTDARAPAPNLELRFLPGARRSGADRRVSQVVAQP